MNTPLISIIIPVYNIERYLRTCIDSILQQSFRNFELILVDDGSTDSSGAICDFYSQADSRGVSFHKKYEGVSVARNYGIDKAQSDWICFIDSDDWVEKDFLLTFSKYLSDKKTLIYQGILFDYENAPQKNSPLCKYPSICISINDYNQIAQFNILHNGAPVAKLFNKQILDNYHIRFIPKLSIYEDLLFVWNYLQHIEKIQLSDMVSYHYMKRNIKSLTTKSHSPKQLMFVIDQLIDSIFQLNKKCNLVKSDYLKKIQIDFPIYQIINMLGCINNKNYNSILLYFQNKISLSQLPITSFKQKILFQLLNSKIPHKIIYIVIRLYNKYFKNNFS